MYVVLWMVNGAYSECTCPFHFAMLSLSSSLPSMQSLNHYGRWWSLFYCRWSDVRIVQIVMREID